jgi:molybdate transport system permease protein
LNVEISPILLTVRVAGLSTLLLVVLGLPLSWWIARGRGRLRWVARLAVNLPLVMPPTVLGFAILAILSPGFASGRFLSDHLGLDILFTWKALVAGSVIGGLPYMCNPLLGGIESLSPSLREASAVLGKGRLETFLRVLVPALRPALVSGIVLAFAHACGEFGVVLMVGGKIPGETTTAALALYDAVETSDYPTGAAYAGILLGLSCLVLVPALRVGRSIAGGAR